MEKQGLKGVEIIGKRQNTAVPAGTMAGNFLPIQLVYQGTTRRFLPSYTCSIKIGTLCTALTTGVMKKP